MRNAVLRAAQGLELRTTETVWRIRWQEVDWLGPLSLRLHDGTKWLQSGTDLPAASLHRFRGRDLLGDFTGLQLHWPDLPRPLEFSARAYRQRPLIVFRIHAREAISGLSFGSFHEPTVAWPTFHPQRREPHAGTLGIRTFGYQFAEFALPVVGDANARGFRLAPHRPSVVEPLLWVAADRRTMMLAPLDHFHEQVISVSPDEADVDKGIRCGWHGDLDAVPAGFATELALWAAASPRQALEEWGSFLQKCSGAKPRAPYADLGLAKLSYWTDNGAHYYYRTEPGKTYVETLASVVDNLETCGLPVGAVQLDSWFYIHEVPHPIGERGAELVPPSGTMLWEPRPDLFPQGFGSLQQELRAHPLILHSRHFSRRSPYFEVEPAWVDGDFAHPQREEFFQRLLAQAANWGAITYEQDWLVESFLRVRGLREEPGRARAWQEALHAAASAHGLTLQWCMASPADFLQCLTLPAVTSIRTSGDYRYLFDNGFHWYWFLCTNVLARSLGLLPFKDVFLSHPPTADSPGEPYAEVEALLAALSTGPVGIGDGLGATRMEVVRRTCRSDGVLVKPDLPIAAIDRCLRTHCFLEPELLVAETLSAHPAGNWVYVVTLNAFFGKERLRGSVLLSDLGAHCPRGPVVAFDWRSRTWQRLAPHDGWEVVLDFQEWDFRVLCPLLPGDVTVFGDIERYATVGCRRLREIRHEAGAISFRVEGAPGEKVTIHGWSATPLRSVSLWSSGTWQELPRARDIGAGESTWCWREDGLWQVCSSVPTASWLLVRLDLAR